MGGVDGGVVDPDHARADRPRRRAGNADGQADQQGHFPQGGIGTAPPQSGWPSTSPWRSPPPRATAGSLRSARKPSRRSPYASASTRPFHAAAAAWCLTSIVPMDSGWAMAPQERPVREWPSASRRSSPRRAASVCRPRAAALRCRRRRWRGRRAPGVPSGCAGQQVHHPLRQVVGGGPPRGGPRHRHRQPHRRAPSTTVSGGIDGPPPCSAVRMRMARAVGKAAPMPRAVSSSTAPAAPTTPRAAAVAASSPASAPWPSVTRMTRKRRAPRATSVARWVVRTARGQVGAVAGGRARRVHRRPGWGPVGTSVRMAPAVAHLRTCARRRPRRRARRGPWSPSRRRGRGGAWRAGGAAANGARPCGRRQGRWRAAGAGPTGRGSRGAGRGGGGRGGGSKWEEG